MSYDIDGARYELLRYQAAAADMGLPGSVDVIGEAREKLVYPPDPTPGKAIEVLVAYEDLMAKLVRQGITSAMKPMVLMRDAAEELKRYVQEDKQ